MVNKEQIDTIVHLRNLGWTQKQISEEVKMSRQAVAYQLKKIKSIPDNNLQTSRGNVNNLPYLEELDSNSDYFIELFRNSDSKGGIILDVGANDGKFCLNMAYIGKKIIAFEDDQLAISKLQS